MNIFVKKKQTKEKRNQQKPKDCVPTKSQNQKLTPRQYCISGRSTQSYCQTRDDLVGGNNILYFIVNGV
jgi:hypothetical protein